MRGESTAYSDLDLVVVYERLECAYRESFVFDGWPVEAFVHDPETLAHFFAGDADSARPSLPNMVVEGIEIPEETDFGRLLKRRAKVLLDAGPAPLVQRDIERFRYLLGDLLDDIRTPRNPAEVVATGTVLYGQVADFWFRSRGEWSASGKTIPRLMRKRDAAFSDGFEAAFGRLFGEGEPSDVVSLVEELLRPFGGCLFAGYRLDAPAEWRMEPDG